MNIKVMESDWSQKHSNRPEDSIDIIDMDIDESNETMNINEVLYSRSPCRNGEVKDFIKKPSSIAKGVNFLPEEQIVKQQVAGCITLSESFSISSFDGGNTDLKIEHDDKIISIKDPQIDQCFIVNIREEGLMEDDAQISKKNDEKNPNSSPVTIAELSSVNISAEKNNDTIDMEIDYQLCENLEIESKEMVPSCSSSIQEESIHPTCSSQSGTSESLSDSLQRGESESFSKISTLKRSSPIFVNEETSSSRVSSEKEIKKDEVSSLTVQTEYSMKRTEMNAEVSQSLSVEKDKNLENIEPPRFEMVEENKILCDENLIKEAKVVRCFCDPTPEEIGQGKGCGSGCINRELYFECGSRCPSGASCSNRRIRNRQYAHVEVFPAGLKGWGLRALQRIEVGQFIIEYVGEVIDAEEMVKRGRRYGKDPKHVHHYLMALKNGAVIDATVRGNISRFINHSCDPNCESQKWTVDRQLRVGFFAIKTIEIGEEIVFDYQLERYGRKAQRCYCGAAICRGLIGVDSDNDSDGIATKFERDSEEDEDDDEKDGSPSNEETKSESISEKKTSRKIRKRRKRNLLEINNRTVWLASKKGPPRNREEVRELVRLMVQIEEASQRYLLVECLQKANVDVLRIFMQHCGLRLIYIFLATDYSIDKKESVFEMQIKCLELLKLLPITTRNQINDSQLAAIVDRIANMYGPIDEAVEDTLNRILDLVCIVSTPFVSGSIVSGEFLEELHLKLINIARELLDSWKDLREEYRIPRREQNGTPSLDERIERLEREELQRRRTVLPEKRVGNSWKVRRIVPSPNENHNHRKRAHSPSTTTPDLPSRKSRFDVSNDISSPSNITIVYENIGGEEIVYEAPPPPTLLPESMFASGLPSFSSCPPVDYNWNPMFPPPFDAMNPMFPPPPGPFVDFYQQQFPVIQPQQQEQNMSLRSVLEAPAPPAEEPKKSNFLTIEPIDLDDVTDEHIKMLEKHLVFLKEKRAENKKRELEKTGSTEPPPPPPAIPPKKSKWVQATTEEGTVYYYNKETRESTWTLPDENEEQADTTSDRNDARAVFKAAIAKHVANILDPIRKTKFATADDYKYVLRKLTHTVLEKELKMIGEGELKVTDSVKEKAKRYVQDYITRLGDGQYSRKNKQHNAY